MTMSGNIWAVLVETEYEGLKGVLDLAEVRWTPGRAVQ